MPVSSPSYFPAQRANDTIVGLNAGIGATNISRCFFAGLNAGTYVQGLSDIIAFGDSALSSGTAAAPVTDANLSGLTIFGSRAAQKLVSTKNVTFQIGPSTIIGSNALAAAVNVTSCTVIGSNALNGVQSNFLGGFLGNTVAIGESVGQNLVDGQLGFASGIRACVFIGNQAASATLANQVASIVESVVIGHQAVNNIVRASSTGGAALQDCVIIGFRAGQTLANNNASGATFNVMIGALAGAADGGSVQGCVYIGAGISGGIGNSTNNVGIGSSQGGTLSTGTNGNVMIGAGAQNAVNNNRCILIGYGAGAGAGAFIASATNDQFLVETVDGPPSGTRRTLLYGVLGAVTPSGLIVGHSTPGTNRDIPTNASNILKILNGTVGTVNPLGGGYFYVAAGALHWVGTSGTDTQIAPA